MAHLSKPYRELFDKLYCSGVYHLHINFDLLKSNEKHYAFEVTRRFLDVCRIINKYWPNTFRYMVAIHGEKILEDAYIHILSRSDEAQSLKDAAYLSLKHVFAELNSPACTLLLEFECNSAQGKNIKFMYDVIPSGDQKYILFKSDFDFLNFFHTVDYYRRTSAPGILFQFIKLEKRETYAICNS